jgi:hypothetical protein
MRAKPMTTARSGGFSLPRASQDFFTLAYRAIDD